MRWSGDALERAFFVFLFFFSKKGLQCVFERKILHLTSFGGIAQLVRAFA